MLVVLVQVVVLLVPVVSLVLRASGSPTRSSAARVAGVTNHVNDASGYARLGLRVRRRLGLAGFRVRVGVRLGLRSRSSDIISAGARRRRRLSRWEPRMPGSTTSSTGGAGDSASEPSSHCQCIAGTAGAGGGGAGDAVAALRPLALAMVTGIMADRHDLSSLTRSLLAYSTASLSASVVLY